MRPSKKKNKYGNRIPELVRKEIALSYVETESYKATARKFGVSPTSVKKFTEECADLVKAGLEKKKKQIDSFVEHMMDSVTKVTEISNLYLEELKKPEKLASTSPTAAATVYGILVDKQFRLEEIRLKRLETELRKKEIAALEKGVSIQIAPVFGDFDGGNDDISVSEKNREGEKDESGNG